jgi:hypothetical protein
MLNTKYTIYDEQNAALNPNALGSAWFVKGVQMVKDPSAEMNALTNLNTKDSAVMNAVNQESLKAINGIDSTASIKLISKTNDALAYQTNSKNTQLAVFSEIYYDKGWKAYIDDKEAPILKANYLLRALVVPAGAHKIKFEFKKYAEKGPRKLSPNGTDLRKRCRHKTLRPRLSQREPASDERTVNFELIEANRTCKARMENETIPEC